jgi:hypothetical protein
VLPFHKNYANASSKSGRGCRFEGQPDLGLCFDVAYHALEFPLSNVFLPDLHSSSEQSVQEQRLKRGW